MSIGCEASTGADVVTRSLEGWMNIRRKGVLDIIFINFQKVHIALRVKVSDDIKNFISPFLHSIFNQLTNHGLKKSYLRLVNSTS